MTQEAWPHVSEEAWRAAALKTLGPGQEHLLEAKTLEGLTRRALETQTVDGVSAARGRVQSPWRVTSLVRAHSLEEGCEAVRREVDGGADAIGLRLDGVASGVPGGWCGDFALPLRTADDVARLVDGVEPYVAWMLDAGGNAWPAARVLAAGLRRAGHDLSQACVLAGLDPFGTLVSRRWWTGSLNDAMHEAGDLVRWCDALGSDWRALHMSAIRVQEAGGDAVQQLAFLLGATAECLRGLERHGIDPQDVARHLSWSLSTDLDVWGGVARCRAARVVFDRMMRACGVESPPVLWLHAVTSQRTLARRDVWTNALRITTQVFAAAVGGADSIRAQEYDAPLGGGTDAGRRLARNTQLILREESHLARSEDPAGGSFFLDRATDDLARAAWTSFRDLERAGGLAEALRKGSFQEAVRGTSHRRQERLRRFDDQRVGVTAWPQLRERIDGRDVRAVETRHDGETGTPVSGDVDLAIEAGASLLDVAATLPRSADRAEAANALVRTSDTRVFESLRQRVESRGLPLVGLVVPSVDSAAGGFRWADVFESVGVRACRVREGVLADVQAAVAQAREDGEVIVGVALAGGADADEALALRCLELGPPVLRPGTGPERDGLHRLGDDAVACMERVISLAFDREDGS